MTRSTATRKAIAVRRDVFVIELSTYLWHDLHIYTRDVKTVAAAAQTRDLRP